MHFLDAADPQGSSPGDEQDPHPGHCAARRMARDRRTAAGPGPRDARHVAFATMAVGEREEKRVQRLPDRGTDSLPPAPLRAALPRLCAVKHPA